MGPALAALRTALKGEPLVEATEHFAVERSLPCGHVRAIHGVKAQLEMAGLIAAKPCAELDRVLAMIAQRVLKPGSKLETAARFSDTILAADFAVEEADEDDLYAAMDWLLGRASTRSPQGGRVRQNAAENATVAASTPPIFTPRATPEAEARASQPRRVGKRVHPEPSRGRRMRDGRKRNGQPPSLASGEGHP